MKYIVKVPKQILGTNILFDCYIRKVISYKRNKAYFNSDIDHAHKYCSESTARKAALAYNGEAVII
jgi:hypothetical protein